MAKELGARGIAVNTAALGAIETDFGGGAVRDNPEINRVSADMTALGRAGLPSGLVEAFTAARALADRQPPGPSQAVLAEFIARGHLTRHVRAMRALYQARRDALVDAVARHAGGLLDIVVPDCGLHAIGYLSPPNPSDAEVCDYALRYGIQTSPLSAYYADGHAPD